MKEYWVHADKIIGLPKDQLRILKRFERGWVIGSYENVLIYEKNGATDKILGGVQCEVVEHNAKMVG